MSNNLRQAAQQALEALEWAWGGEPLTGKEMVAIAALRAALAEPEQAPISLNNGRLTQYPDGSIGVGTLAEREQPVAHVRDRGNPCYMFTALPSQQQPEQEPVAWSGYDLDAMVEAFGRVIEAHHSNNHPFHNPIDSDARMALRILRGFIPAMKAYTAPTPRKPQREHITDGSPCWCNPDVIEEEGGDVIVHNYEDNWQQYAKPGETAQQCIERHRGEQDALMKLYATPRRPLTDEEIERACVPLGAAMLSFTEVARAIERAHGIGGGE